MKQTLGVIRALLHDPPVVVLDEPTRSLSPDQGRRVTRLLRRLAEEQGRTILLATHNLLEAQNVAHEIAILHQGRIVASGDPGTLHRQAGLTGLPSLEALFMAYTGGGDEGEP
jgi:ABC-type multidrug transport system ATPase subunit